MEKIKTIVSPIDERDFKAELFLDYATTLPKAYTAPSTSVRCQWFSSQCVAFACTQAMSQQEKLNTRTYNVYSPGLLYANREDGDWQGEGWYIRKALKQLYHYGTCLEKDFPLPESYKTEKSKFEENKAELLAKAAEHKISAYFRCNTEEEIKRCIMQKGGCIISIQFYNQAFISPHYHKPAENVKAHGGHALIIVGWTENNEWIVQDSYSIFRPKWGKVKIDFDYPIDEYWGICL